MRTLLQKVGAFALAMLGIGQAYAAHFGASWDVDTIKAHVGDEISFNDFAFTEIVEVKSSDNSVAEVVNDSIYIRTSYYNGQGMYEQKSAQLMLISSKADTFVSVLNVAREAVLVDGQPYTNNEKVYMESIKYTRSVSETAANTWQPYIFPFRIDVEKYINEFDVAEEYDYGAVSDSNGDGVVDVKDNYYNVFKQVTKGYTKPNKPLLIRVKKAGVQEFVSYNDSLFPIKLDTVSFVEPDYAYSLIPVYANKVLEGGDNNFYIGTSGNYSWRVTSNATLKSYRWFIHAESRTGVDVELSTVQLANKVVGENFEMPKPIMSRKVRIGEVYEKEYFEDSTIQNFSKIESSDVKVAYFDNDSVFIVAHYYDGQNKYVTQSCNLTLINDYGKVVAYVNLEVEPEAVLVDGQPYTNNEKVYMESIKYTRSVSETAANTWQPYVFPFRIDVEKCAKEFDVAEEYDYGAVSDSNGDGVVDVKDNFYNVFKQVTKGYTKPNKPLLIRVKKAGVQEFVSYKDSLFPVKLDTVPFEEQDYAYSLIPVYTNKVLEGGDNNFYIGTSGNYSWRSTSSATLKSYRWFIHAESRTGLTVELSTVQLANKVVGENFEMPKPIVSRKVRIDEVYEKEYFEDSTIQNFSKIESSDVKVAYFDNDSVFIDAHYYDGQNKYVPQSCKLTLINDYGKIVGYVNLEVESETKLVDGQSYTNKDTLSMVSIKYSRSVSETAANTWQPYIFPFKIDVENYANDFDVAEYFGYGAMSDTNGDGVINGDDKLYNVFKQVTEGLTKPNKPLLIRVKEAGVQEFIVENDTLFPIKLDTVKFEEPDYRYSLIPTYTNKVLEGGDNNFYIGTSGNYSWRSTSSATLKSYRWFVHADSKSGVPVELSTVQLINKVVPETFEFPKADTIPVIGDDTTDVPGGDTTVVTSIKLIECDNISEPEIYNVNGVKVKSLDNAPAGIYIVNRKKVLINKNK